ncbi:MAG: ATP-binding protein [Syntrophorhabdaceae bacterium]|nr:ATP-binding protein [Syntrophorhabdaceae bacterium]
MMEELSFHIMDMVINSIEAEAKHIEVEIVEDDISNTLTILIRDDGKGIKEGEKIMDDRFITTKKGKTVGLGIPLLKGTAETCGGSFSLKSNNPKGIEIRASFEKNHPDLPPLGNLKDTFLILIGANPDVDFSFTVKKGGHEFVLDTAKIKEQLEELPINHPEVMDFLKKYMEEYL